jgi:hypothetical protein
MAASLASAQPTVRHERLFIINLVLMLLSLQAVAIAAVRLWQQAGPDTNTDPHAETPGQPSLDAQTTADGFDVGIPDGPKKGGRYADDDV